MAEPTFILGTSISGVTFSFYDEITLSKLNSSSLDAEFCGAHHGLYGLPMSHRKDVTFVLVTKVVTISEAKFLYKIFEKLKLKEIMERVDAIILLS